MTDRNSKSARAIAAEVLQRFDPVRAYAGPSLDSLLDQTQEKQRATDLVYGTIRNLHAIDAAITQFSGRPVARISPALLSIIRVAVYELAYSPAAPVYSIVNEAVNDAARAGGRKQTGFVNAVLRQIVRHISDRQAGLSPSNARRTLIQTPEAGCLFDNDFLPDPAGAAAAYLSTCFSLPQWLVTQWLDEYGPEQTRSICLGCNRRPSLYVRVNPLRTTTRGLLEKFEQAAIHAEPVVLDRIVETGSSVRSDAGRRSFETPSRSHDKQAAPDNAPRIPEMIRITGPHAVTQLPGFPEGLFTVQDLSASQVVRTLNPQPGWSILDLCSAPGTKTTQLAEATQDSARITATDIDPQRLERVQENIARLGLRSVTVVPYAQLQDGAGGPFDAVLLDVPCSNTGVLARRVEARWRVKPQAIEELAAMQSELLQRAASVTKPGARVCYSTCSIQRREDSDVIHDFLAGSDQFELIHEQLVLPAAGPFDHDGGYVAVLTRKS